MSGSCTFQEYAAGSTENEYITNIKMEVLIHMDSKNKEALELIKKMLACINE